MALEMEALLVPRSPKLARRVFDGMGCSSHCLIDVWQLLVEWWMGTVLAEQAYRGVTSCTASAPEG